MFKRIYISFLNYSTLVHNCCIFSITHSKLLVLETCSTPLHVSLLPTSPDTHLISACDDGLYVFDIQLSKNTQKRFEFSISWDIIIPLLINLCGKEIKILYWNSLCFFFSEMRRWRLCFQSTRKTTRKTPTGLLTDWVSSQMI